jgi:hypothetical protein
MSQLRRILSNSLTVFAGVLTVAFVLLVALIIAGDDLRPLWWRFISESDRDSARSPQAMFDRYRRQQQDIASGADRGPMRCTLEPWPGDNVEHPDLRLSLTNTSAEPLAMWYYTWPHSHVNFLLRDPDGKPVASFHWGMLSSQAVGIDGAGRPTTRLPTLTLQPGETYTAGFWLTSLRDYRPVPPGNYIVEAVFVYHDLGGLPDGEQRYVARSEGVWIVVEPEDDKYPVWQLARP